MKKILLIGCIMLILFCAPKKTTVETEGVDEVIVFGEEEAAVSEEPVLPEIAEEEDVTPVVPKEEPMMPEPTEEEIITPPVIEEEPIAPPAVEEEIAVIPPTVEEEPAVPIPPVEETPAPTPSPEQLLGFRIQIFASSTEKNASRVADNARESFTENVYINHIAPYYKIRVGDCLTREDAEVLKNKALRLGYRGAFIVETMITP